MTSSIRASLLILPVLLFVFVFVFFCWLLVALCELAPFIKSNDTASGGAVPVLAAPPKAVGVRAALCKLVPFIKSNNNATVDVSSAAAGAAVAAWFGVVGSVWRVGLVLEEDVGRRCSFVFFFFEDGLFGSFVAEDLMRFSTLVLFSSFEDFSFVFFFFFFEDGFFGSFVVEDAALVTL